MIKLLSCKDLVRHASPAFREQGIRVLEQISGESENVNGVHSLLSHVVFPQYVRVLDFWQARHERSNNHSPNM